MIRLPHRARFLVVGAICAALQNAVIIAGTLNPYKTDLKEHLEYHRFNKKRGRMGGQIRFRIRYGKTIGDWFDYLFVSPEEMREILKNTGWQVKEFLDSGKANYYAVIEKTS